MGSLYLSFRIKEPSPFVTFRSFQKILDTQVKFSSTFHHQMDGQAERTIKTLEDMLRACVIDYEGRLDDHLPLIEFSYNNSYHYSIGMTPFESIVWQEM